MVWLCFFFRCLWYSVLSRSSGGGICGLCLAVSLSKDPSIEVSIYEAAQRFSEIGAGVMIWAKTWRILEIMGLADQFSKVAHAPPDGSIGVGFDFRKSDQPQEGFRFLLSEMPYGCIRFHRAHFLDVLINNLPEGIAHFNKRLSSYTRSSSSSPITLCFADDSTAVCDLVIGCDGIKSTIRTQMYREEAERTKNERGDWESIVGYIEPVWSGTIAYRGLIPASRLKEGHSALSRPMMVSIGTLSSYTAARHVVSYSISQGSIVNVVTFASEPEKEGIPYEGPWVTECSRQELLDCYADWEPEVEELLQCIDKPTRWAIHHLKPLPFYVTDRVALLGDAAHAMTPHLGAGAGQAIEDAYILSLLLQHPDTDIESIPLVLEAYEDARLRKAQHILEGSWDAALLYEFNSEMYGSDCNRLADVIQRQWGWVWESTPEEDEQNVLKWLSEQKRLRKVQ
ncbi:FAD/NAD P-binding domain-containing protein [Gloeophyllum trabeum ATCC 11539]|uniref:FAD/NAD P-binding domain-containing protein n=1 Tax=Gloeophyllum trabeum (strain ATCC 11539 / FP-39264 / Madison 617) TaxID=670483 RepID=S7RR24_GLOTA|nr:FAD/NAD P-binding domain-containing protein [Gloeophyllum trabeum ATCC 11539]EPQ57035.1 FAD/NAD P-binding domain-containing protein [Gloeophyllum trabeum ATCC 11539]